MDESNRLNDEPSAYPDTMLLQDDTASSTVLDLLHTLDSSDKIADVEEAVPFFASHAVAPASMSLIRRAWLSRKEEQGRFSWLFDSLPHSQLVEKAVRMRQDYSESMSIPMEVLTTQVR